MKKATNTMLGVAATTENNRTATKMTTGQGSTIKTLITAAALTICSGMTYAKEKQNEIHEGIRIDGSSTDYCKYVDAKGIRIPKIPNIYNSR